MFNYKKLLYCILTGIVLAILLHIVIVLSLPYFSKHNAWHRISKTFKPYTFNVLSNKYLPKGKPMITGLDPLFVTAACHFNLNDGPLEITAKGYAPYWSLSIYDTQNINHYSLNDKNTNSQNLNALVVTPAQKGDWVQKQSQNESPPVIIEVPLKKGLAVLRFLQPDDTWQTPIQAFIKSAGCQTLKPNQETASSQ